MAILKEIRQLALEKWRATSLREQRLAAFLALFLLALLIYFIWWAPAAQTVATLQQSVAEKKAVLAWMQRQEPTITALRQKQRAQAAHRIPGPSLLGFINSSGQAHQLILQRIQPGAANTVQLWLEDASFAELTAWLAELHLQGIFVYSFKARPGSKTGLVHAEVSLKSSGP